MRSRPAPFVFIDALYRDLIEQHAPGIVRHLGERYTRIEDTSAEGVYGGTWYRLITTDL